jgi:hypothetical protein
MQKNPTVFQIQEKLAALEIKLNESVPNISILLKEIYTILKKDPDVVTILSNEECSILVRGLKKQTNTEISSSILKNGTKKSLSKITLTDL